MSVKGRAVFANKVFLQNRPKPTSIYERQSSAQTALDNLVQELEDAYFALPIMGAVNCLIRAGYTDTRIKGLVKPYAMSLLPKNVDEPGVPMLSDFQEMLYDMYQWPWADMAENAIDEDAKLLLAGSELTGQLFEDIVREYGGQEELDKIHRALEDAKVAKQEAHECACCQSAVPPAG